MDDLISRQAAIDAIEHRLAEPAYLHNGEDWYVGMNSAEFELDKLPSVQTEHTAYWIVLKDDYGDIVEAICSNCQNNGNHEWEYCPHCGAKMEMDE